MVALADLRRVLREESAVRVVARLKAIVYPEPAPEPPSLPQLVFWSIDAEGLPPRPWRLLPDDVFDCVTLDCKGMPARTCVLRQQVTEKQRTEQLSRGQGTDYPHCDSSKCVQGRAIREAVEAVVGRRWRKVGIGGRFALLGNTEDGKGATTP